MSHTNAYDRAYRQPPAINGHGTVRINESAMGRRALCDRSIRRLTLATRLPSPGSPYLARRS